MTSQLKYKGETGLGKSTFIESFIEALKPLNKQTQLLREKTTSIITYDTIDINNNLSIQFIDTPGVGDTPEFIILYNDFQMVVN